MIRFFRNAVADAMSDPFFPARNRVHAVVWVLWNWRWLRRLYS